MFHYAETLTSRALQSGLPWEFQPGPIADEIRHDKLARQAWYRNPATRHCFYTGVEPANPTFRPTKDKGDNPARFIRALVADYDLRLERDMILAGVAKMADKKPSWLETSLGLKFRLIWLLESPIPCFSSDFAAAALRKLRKWLPLDRLPGLDEPAFVDPTRLYANGGVWEHLGNPPLPTVTVNGLIVEIGREFSFCGANSGPVIPLDVAYKLILEKFGPIAWPGEFTLNSQGPSFWVPGSTSPFSAIVKETGLFTFAAHAAQPFYPWRELLGADAVDKYTLQAMGESTTELYFDGERYFRKLPDGSYCAEKTEEIRSHLKIDRRLSSKKAPGEDASPVDLALQHVRNYNRVEGAAPFVFRVPGIIRINGGKVLNTYCGSALLPAGEPAVWAAEGNLPFLYTWLPRLFRTSEQLEFVVAWLSYAYRGAYERNPQPGHSLFLAGGTGVGKTLFAREVVGGLMGGFADAASLLAGSDNFNSDMFRVGVWCVDDETLAGDERGRRRFAAMIKKITANQSFRYNEKYRVASRVDWCGRAVVTLNLDETSSRTLVDTELSMMDKVALVRAADGNPDPKGKPYPDFIFPTRPAIIEKLARELPYFARYLLDYSIPTSLLGQTRYGVTPHHDRTLVERASQSSASAMFHELLVDWMRQHFEVSKGDTWQGTTTQLLKAMLCDPAAAEIVRKYTPEQAGRLLASIKAQGLLRMRAETRAGLRLWTLFRTDV